MKSVVVGANGFVGTVIVRQLLEREHTVVSLDRNVRSTTKNVESVAGDIRDIASLESVFRGADEVYHVAASLGTSELEEGIRSAIQVNILGTLNVLEAACMQGVSRVFVATKPSVWLNTYTITKHCSEQLTRQFANYNPIDVFMFRYLNIFGPGQKLQPVRKVLPIFAAQAMRGLPIQVFGDGEQTVDMLFVDDAARLTVDFMKTPPTGEAIDCGTGEAITVLEVAKAVNDFFENKAGIEHIAMRKGETAGTQLVADTRGLDAALPNRTYTPWEVALETSLKWYADLPDRAIDSALSYYGISSRYRADW